MKTGVWMKRAAILCLGGIWAAGARGADMKTLDGTVYSNVVVQRFDRQGLYIRYDGGSTQVLFQAIMPELRDFYKSRSLIPLSMNVIKGEKEEPAGPNDLETVTGEIYRNVVLKQVNENSILISHDTGMTTLKFALLTPAQAEQYRSHTPVVPDPAPGAKDMVTTAGQIFRNIEVVRAEPDGLTIRHDGGMNKVWFIALPESVQEQYGFDPIAARKYHREMIASNQVPEVEVEEVVEQSTHEPTFTVRVIEIQTLTNNSYWVRFMVDNLIDENQKLFIVPCVNGSTPITAGKSVIVTPLMKDALQQAVVPEIKPTHLKVSSETYFTNTTLTWE